MNIVVAQCRVGFEPEAAADLASVAAQAQCALDIHAPPGRGYVLARSDTLDLGRWARAESTSPPIFIRSSFVGGGLRAQATMGETLTRAGVRFELAFRQLYHDREEVTGYIARID